MKNLAVLKLFVLSGILLLGIKGQAQNPINWTERELEDPAELANSITAKKNVPVIISVGPGAIIPNSVDVNTLVVFKL